MRTSAFFVFAFVIGCSGNAKEGHLGSSEGADTGGIAENTPEAKGILRVANEASLSDLESSTKANLSTRAAESIDNDRVGDDGVRGTADDLKFGSLGELDAVPFVGPKEFASLLAYAKVLGYVGGTATGEHYDNTTSAAIADLMSITSDISVPTSGASGSIDVPIDITHTWIGDLIITLTHNGTTATLWSRTGGGTHDIHQTFSTSAFSGMDRNGLWRLTISDNSSGDSGTLNRWGITFSGGGTACQPTTCNTQGKNCGTISDNCGGTLDCGTCSGSDTCGGGGTSNVCGDSSPTYTCGFNNCGPNEVCCYDPIEGHDDCFDACN